ncbi:MAG: SLC13 family permease [Caulobacteraceae bacterium]
MVLQQAPVGEILAFAILAVAVILFASGRLRYDVTAVGALLAGVLLGVVPAKEAFSGFTSDVVVIIASALVVSAAVGRSGAVEMALRPLLGRLKSARSQVPVLAGVTALLSMTTKNVGALAVVMPAALQLARKTGSSPSSLLMPMSFLSLLGGLVTLVGTSTNIIVSQVREENAGKPFAMFDFAPVGLCLTAMGLVLVSVAWPLLPRNRQGQTSLGEAVADAPYATEATVTEETAKAFATVADLKLAEEGVKLTGIAAGGAKHEAPLPDAALHAGDVLILEGDQEALDRMLARTPLKAAREGREVEKGEATEEMRSVEAVVQSGSVLVGQSAQRMALKQQYGVNLLAVGRGGERISQRLRDIGLRPGDILVLQAGERALPNILKTLGVLPLAERDVRFGGVRRRIAPVLILAAAMTLVAFGVLPVAIAFFGAAVLMVVTGALPMRDAYESLDGQVLVLIGALTPISEAVRRTGGADLIAGGLAEALHGVSPMLALAALLVVAMACSPFLHNAPTVLVLGPIGVLTAQRLHLNPDPFLMAVATGAGCDFLTPIGHQCNTLVAGPGGYRFTDYWRLGAPLSVMVVLAGPPLIAWVWPLAVR